MNNKTIDFIEKSNKVHGFYYSYLLSDYINAKQKIKIVCPKHGLFEQSPTNHLTGKGCRQCGRIKASLKIKLSTKEFIKKAKKIHGNKYDYSLVEYEYSKKNIKIICSKHGVFEQKPNNHLNGCGCPNCYADKITQNTKDFIKKANKVHHNQYNYFLTKYIDNKTSLNIICSVHGKFKQLPSNHLYGFGCPNCGGTKKLTTDSFTKKAKQIHGNKYDYSHTKYINSDQKVKIICKKHGEFLQNAGSHLQNKGCPKCINKFSKGHKKLFDLCKTLHPLKKIIIEKSFAINNKKYYVDIFIEKCNIIVEYHGDYWHCNPNKYKPDYFHPHKKMYAKDIWNYDENRKKELENLGYEVFIIWEKDFKTNQEKINKLLSSFD